MDHVSIMKLYKKKRHKEMEGREKRMNDKLKEQEWCIAKG